MLIALMLTGCIPMDAPAIPEVTLRVVDAKTARPISGAIVTITAEADASKQRVGRTDAQGMVHLAGMDRTIWRFPAIVPFAFPVAKISVEAPGYQIRDLSSDGGGYDYIIGTKPVSLVPN
jgi:hypothetical protein